jgi:homospermidine synthase
MIEQPDAGLRVPDELPWEQVLAVARRYLGTCHSDATDWTPLRARHALDLFPSFGVAADGLDLDDPWQFGNFLVS